MRGAERFLGRVGLALRYAALLLATAIEVTVPGPAGPLAGTLTLPARGRGPFPAVVTP